MLNLDYTFVTVALGTTIVGIVSGLLGSFTFLRRQSLVGDVIAHCALPGIALAFLITGSKNLFGLALGAAATGWLGSVGVSSITKRTRITTDTALGMILAVFFGFGIVLLTFIQRQPNAAQAGLNTFLFGQAATLLKNDVIVMAILGTLAVLLTAGFWKEWKLIIFDPEYAQSLNWPVRILDIGLISTLVIAVVIGLQSVGVVLISSLIIAPAAAARQWTDRFGVMLGLAMLVGGVSGFSGAAISSTAPRMPTGPIIVIVAGGIVLFSLLFGQTKGLVWHWWRRYRQRQGVRADSVLLAFYKLAQDHSHIHHPMDIALLEQANLSRQELSELLKVLAEKNYIRHYGGSEWALTEKGEAIAAARLNQKDDET